MKEAKYQERELEIKNKNKREVRQQFSVKKNDNIISEEYGILY